MHRSWIAPTSRSALWGRDGFLLSYDRAVHSDFLVHWTGRDIDATHHPQWYTTDHRSKTSAVVDDLYLKRLRDVLRFGLWMTEDSRDAQTIGYQEYRVPQEARCCFTELRLSESRRHAALYGRLGIGVKRPFVFQRGGRPLIYFGFGANSHSDRFVQACFRDLQDKSLLNFFKPMNSQTHQLTYELYAESEWRILFFEQLLKQRKVIDPRDPANAAEHEYYLSLTEKEQERLRYLIPLDGWLGVVIYPSLTAKDRAQWDDSTEIRREVTRIKSDQGDHANRVEGWGAPRRGNWPIELNLDACRNL